MHTETRLQRVRDEESHEAAVPGASGTSGPAGPGRRPTWCATRCSRNTPREHRDRVSHCRAGRQRLAYRTRVHPTHNGTHLKIHSRFNTNGCLRYCACAAVAATHRAVRAWPRHPARVSCTWPWPPACVRFQCLHLPHIIVSSLRVVSPSAGERPASYFAVRRPGAPAISWRLPEPLRRGKHGTSHGCPLPPGRSHRGVSIRCMPHIDLTLGRFSCEWPLAAAACIRVHKRQF